MTLARNVILNTDSTFIDVIELVNFVKKAHDMYDSKRENAMLARSLKAELPELGQSMPLLPTPTSVMGTLIISFSFTYPKITFIVSGSRLNGLRKRSPEEVFGKGLRKTLIFSENLLQRTRQSPPKFISGELLNRLWKLSSSSSELKSPNLASPEIKVSGTKVSKFNISRDQGLQDLSLQRQL
ncbi:hypothetical protein Nepgr_006880 [Nepenthes gracilis]|uniref:Uncharacterized protein n=1 Tax=Nepenthes gracilis TaxID=150966 RepID=A0AAD3XHV0_NEPGR|nr:hypothetical protein Nepgr_006880 [Nepenthes gracilis]